MGILAKCGVSSLLDTLRIANDKIKESDTKEALSNIDGLSGKVMYAAIKGFCGYVFSLGALAMPQVDRISIPTIHFRVRQGVSARIAKAYTEFHNALSDPQNQY